MATLTIRQKLICMFLILIIPIFLLNWFAIDKAEEILKNHVTDAYVELIKQNTTILDRDIDTVSKITTTIIQNPLTQGLVPGRSTTKRQRIDEYQDMDGLLKTYSIGVNGETIKYSLFIPDDDELYDFAPRYPSTDKSYAYFFPTNEKPEWFDEAVSMKGKGMFKIIDSFGSHPVKTLAYIRAVNSVTQGNTVLGVIVATNLDNKLGNSINSVSLPEGNVYLTNMRDELFYGTDHKFTLGSTIETPDWSKMIHTSANVSYAINNDMIDVVHHNYRQQYQLIYKIPTISLVQQQNVLKNYIQLISLAYFILCLLIFLYFLRSLIAPLLKMVSFFKMYEPGKTLPKLPEIQRKDEVGGLISSIHDMAQRFNQLVYDKYIMEIQQKESQLHLLYEQINPHLLYNTLESIYWKCAMQGENEAAEMIKDLSKLMKISLSRGKELITLEEEFEHARAYVSLQQKRFDYEFTVKWMMDREMHNYLVPKITLQPIIENAILHGVRNMGEDGEVTISAYKDKENVYLQVEDNGYKQVDCAALQRSLDEALPSSSGYGARNVHKRIQLHYGSRYGLVYEPREPQGIKVRIVLPARTMLNTEEGQ